jgi:hypothetical protein
MASTCHPTTQAHDYTIFEKWMTIKQTIDDVDFSLYASQLPSHTSQTFQYCYLKQYNLLHNHQAFLSTLTNNVIYPSGYDFNETSKQSILEQLQHVYEQLEYNLPELLEKIVTLNDQLTIIAQQETSIPHNQLINTNKALAELLVSCTNRTHQNKLLIALANRLFEACFSTDNFHKYQKTMVNQALFPIARFINTTLWYNLVGEGWKHWHKQTLDYLKVKHDKGKTIWYIAGGNDIYQLLKNGIYNMTVIDPFLPSQEAFYAANYEFLLNGTLGDTIACHFENNPVTLKRTECRQENIFYAPQPENKLLKLKEVYTVWHVHDATDTIVGSITLERRFARQQDFQAAPDKCIVMSYDEMVYLASPDHLNGWGINLDDLPEDFELVIKQLRKPIGLEQVYNMRIATQLNASDLQFISYGSNPN